MFQNNDSDIPKHVSQNTWLGKNENDIIMNLFL